jgi:hypothetical protein
MIRGETIAFTRLSRPFWQVPEIRLPEPFAHTEGDRVTVLAFNLVVLVVVLISVL